MRHFDRGLVAPFIASLAARAKTTVAHPLFLPALTGIAVRLVLLPYVNWSHDYYWFYGAANDMLSARNPYASSIYIYPPLFAYLFFPFVYASASIFGRDALAHTIPELDSVGAVTGMVTSVVTGPAFNVAVKLPVLLADFGVGLLLFSMMKSYRSERLGTIAFASWFLNPYVIAISSLAGQFDAIPAFLTLLAFVLVLRSRYLTAGVSIGLGAMFKAYPTFFGIAIVGLILGRIMWIEGRTPRVGLKGLAGYFGGIAIVGLAFLGPLYFSPGFQTTFRWASGFNVGGLTFWSLTNVEQFSWFRSALIDLQPTLQASLLMAGAAASALIAYAAWRCLRRKSAEEFRVSLGLAISTLGAVYLILTNINPQYVVWIYPYLILAAGVNRRFIIYITTISIAALGYLLSLQGPLAFFYPLAVYTQVISIGAINDSILSYWSTELMGVNLRSTLLFGFGFLGFLSIVGIMLSGIGLLIGAGSRRNLEPVEAGMRKVPHSSEETVRFPVLAVVLLTTVLLVTEVTIYAVPPAEEGISIEVKGVATQEGPGGLDGVLVSYELSGGASASSLRVIAVPVYTPNVFPDVYFYYDEAYPVVAIGRDGLKALASNLHARLTIQGYPTEMKMVSASQLEEIFVAGCTCTVIVASSVLPESVFSKEVNLLTPFVENGGVLIWIGDLIGGYVATRGQEDISWEDPRNPQWEGEKAIFGESIIASPSENLMADIPTAIAKTLGIQFRSIRTGALLSELLTRNAQAIGYITDGSDPRSSVSVIELGKGRVVLFGGHAASVESALSFFVVARDVAQILRSGIIFSSAAPVYADHYIEPHVTVSNSLTIRLDSIEERPAAVVVYSFSTDDFVNFYWEGVYPIGPS